MGLRPMRPHQVDGLAMLRRATVEEKAKQAERAVRIIFAAPCSYGKTNVAAHMFTSALNKGLRCLFTVPRLTLVEQAVADFEADGLTGIGVIQGRHARTDPYARLQVASVQTMMNREMHKPDLLIIDEAHLQFAKLNNLLASAEWRNIIVIGLTGTPGAKGMGKHWHRLVVPATLKGQMERGLMSSYVAYAPASQYEPDMSGVGTVAGEFNEAQSAAVMSDRKLVGHVVDHWLTKGEGKPTFLYAVDRGHAQLLQQQFLEHGIPWGLMDGDTPWEGDGGRKDLFDRLHMGLLRGIASVATLIEGVNAPHVGCIIDCQPTKSRMRQGQKIPRMLRLDSDDPEKVAILLDHAGNTQRLGVVENFVWDTLDDGEKKADESTASERKEPLPRKCKCGLLLDIGVYVCPKCGAQKELSSEIQHVPGELVLFGSGAKGKQGADKVPQEVKTQFYAELLGYAEQHGKKPGSAYYRYKEKFGVFPVSKPKPQPPSMETQLWIKSRAIRYAKGKAKAKAA